MKKLISLTLLLSLGVMTLAFGQNSKETGSKTVLPNDTNETASPVIREAIDNEIATLEAEMPKQKEHLNELYRMRADAFYREATEIGLRDHVDPTLLSDEHCDLIRNQVHSRTGSITAATSTTSLLSDAQAQGPNETLSEIIQKGFSDGQILAEKYNDECAKRLHPPTFPHYGLHFSNDNPTDQLPE